MHNLSILKERLVLLELPNEAMDWLLSLFDVIQKFDDILDKDNKLTNSDIYKLIYLSLVSMPTNAFYVTHISHLAPLINTNLLKWIASNEAESNKQADAKSFMWRAGYYEIVLHCVFICHGFEFTTTKAKQILSIYGENFNDYLKEFGQCQTQ